MLFLVGSEEHGYGWEKRKSMEKRRNAGMETASIGRLLDMLLILAGDVELNPGPIKLGMISIHLISSRILVGRTPTSLYNWYKILLW